MWKPVRVNLPKAGVLPTGMTNYTFQSNVMGCEVGYCIYLPPGYDQEPNKRYPVSSNLHGAGGSLARFWEGEAGMAKSRA